MALNHKEIANRFFTLFSVKNQTALAEQLGVSTSAITDWKKGRSAIPWSKLIKAVESTGVTWDWLLTGKEDASYPDPTEEPGYAPGMDEKVALCLENATFIHQHLGEAQRYLLRGELSADAFLRLADSLVAEIESAIAARRKRRQSSDSGDQGIGA